MDSNQKIIFLIEWYAYNKETIVLPKVMQRYVVNIPNPVMELISLYSEGVPTLCLEDDLALDLYGFPVPGQKGELPQDLKDIFHDIFLTKKNYPLLFFASGTILDYLEPALKDSSMPPRDNFKVERLDWTTQNLDDGYYVNPTKNAHQPVILSKMEAAEMFIENARSVY